MSISGSNTASKALQSEEPITDEPSMDEILASIKEIIAEDEAAELSLQDREQYEHPADHSNSNLAIELSKHDIGHAVTEISVSQEPASKEDEELSLMAGLEAAMEDVLLASDVDARAELPPTPDFIKGESTTLRSDTADFVGMEFGAIEAELSAPDSIGDERAVSIDVAPLPDTTPQPPEQSPNAKEADSEAAVAAGGELAAAKDEPVSAAREGEQLADVPAPLSETGTHKEEVVEPVQDATAVSADEFADELSKAVEIIAADEAEQAEQSALSPDEQSGKAAPVATVGPQLSPGVEAVPSLHQRAEKVRQEFSSITSGLSADERLAKYRVRNTPDLPTLKVQRQEHVAQTADPAPVAQVVVEEPQTIPAPAPAPAPEPAIPPTFAVAEAVAKSLLDEKEAEFEQMVANIVRPTIRKWLSENLPGLVEKLVREEIESVSRGKRAS